MVKENFTLNTASSVLSGVVILLLTIFITASWNVANLGNQKAEALEQRVTVVEQDIKYIMMTTQEIKEIVKKDYSRRTTRNLIKGEQDGI